MNDDDTPTPIDDWLDLAPTTIGVLEIPPDHVTAPHAVIELAGFEIGRKQGYDAGCQACYAEGQDDALIALTAVFHEHGWTDAVVDATIARVRSKLTRF